MTEMRGTFVLAVFLSFTPPSNAANSDASGDSAAVVPPDSADASPSGSDSTRVDIDARSDSTKAGHTPAVARATLWLGYSFGAALFDAPLPSIGH